MGTEEVDIATESAEPIERWTAKRRAALVIRILKDETSMAETARLTGSPSPKLRTGARSVCWGPRTRCGRGRRTTGRLKAEQVKKFKHKIGEFVLDNDLLREAVKPYSLDRKTSNA
jgi:hypothetical protein